MPPSTSFSLHPDEVREPARGSRKGLLALVVLLLVGLGLLGYLAYTLWERTAALDRQIALLREEAERSAALSRQGTERAIAAETAARAAAEGRQQAEEKSATDREAAGAAQQEAGAARLEAGAARQEAAAARETAARAEAEADRIRKKAEADTKRLEAALGQVAETRQTALGLVMNLGGDYLKFEFDKADLRPEDRERLSRIAGILLTAPDYTVSVNGHTDDVGSDAYNRKLSERRAQAVRDYLVSAGLSQEILTVEGHGKALPLVPGSSDTARARNRRVELGIVNMQIKYLQ
jgi:outer membrane protein OmpA-like peptidoglycan-associated protein